MHRMPTKITEDAHIADRYNTAAA